MRSKRHAVVLSALIASCCVMVLAVVCGAVAPDLDEIWLRVYDPSTGGFGTELDRSVAYPGEVVRLSFLFPAGERDAYSNYRVTINGSVVEALDRGGSSDWWHADYPVTVDSPQGVVDFRLSLSWQLATLTYIETSNNSVATIDRYPPPQNVEASGCDSLDSITVSWDAVGRHLGYSADVYHVSRGPSATGPFTHLGDVVAPSTSYVDSPPVTSDPATYYYVVQARAGMNHVSGYSDPAAGQLGVAYYYDYDGDGIGTDDFILACSPNDDTLYRATESGDWCDQNGEIQSKIRLYYDYDDDGYGTSSYQNLCSASGHYTASRSGDECDQNASLRYLNYYYYDGDGDGYGAGQGEKACGPDEATGYTATSCCDYNDDDDSCHRTYTFHRDYDGDGYVSGYYSDYASYQYWNGHYYETQYYSGWVPETYSVCAPSATEPPAGYRVAYSYPSVDCDDWNHAATYKRTYYKDADGDGRGITWSFTYSCYPTSDYTTTSYGDCNDAIADTTTDGYWPTYYLDADGDGYGTGDGKQTCGSSERSYTATRNDDCDDDDADATVRMYYYIDKDGDGYATGYPDDRYYNVYRSWLCGPSGSYTAILSDLAVTPPRSVYASSSNASYYFDWCDSNPDLRQPIAFYEDIDSDGYGGAQLGYYCAAPQDNAVTHAGDCDDDEPFALSFTAIPEVVSAVGIASFSWEAGGGVCSPSFAYCLDEGHWVDTEGTSVALDSLEDGAHTFSVKVTNAMGEAEPIVCEWAVYASPPTATIASEAASRIPTTGPRDITFVVEFSQPIVLLKADFILVGGTAEASVDRVERAGENTYHVTVHAMGVGTVRIEIPIGGVENIASLANARPFTSPTIHLTAGDDPSFGRRLPGNGEIVTSLSVTFSWEELPRLLVPPTGGVQVEIEPLDPRGQTIRLEASSSQTLMDPVELADGVYRWRLGVSGSYRETAWSPWRGDSEFSSWWKLTVDTDSEPPTAAVAPWDGQPAITNDPALVFSIEFSRPVFGFDAYDLAVEGGTLVSLIAVSDARYRAEIEALASGPVSLLVRPIYVRDARGRFCKTSNVAVVTYDMTPPANPPVASFASSQIPGTWFYEAPVEMSWSGAMDAESGVGGYSVLWDDLPDTMPDGLIDIPQSEDPHSATNPPLEVCTEHWFHLRTVDLAGNASSEVVHLGPYGGLDCEAFETWEDAQAARDYCDDLGFDTSSVDGDGDGTACESLMDCNCTSITCGRFSDWDEAQACYEYCSERGYSRLDGDDNGTPCESLMAWNCLELDCGEFDSWEDAQAAREYCVARGFDVSDIDGDGDGTACEARMAEEVCNCAGADLDCSDFGGDWDEAQACFEFCRDLGNYGRDVFNLDGNGDAIACEKLLPCELLDAVLDSDNPSGNYVGAGDAVTLTFTVDGEAACCPEVELINARESVRASYAGSNTWQTVFAPLPAGCREGVLEFEIELSCSAATIETTGEPELILDASPPVISGCPVDITLSNDPGLCSAVVSWIEPTADDYQSGLESFDSTHSPGDTFIVGTTTVTYTAADSAGNTATCSFNVTVTDDENPTDPTTFVSTSHTASSWSNDGTVAIEWSGAADNCGVVGYSILWDTNALSSPDTTIDVAHSSDPHSATSPTLVDGAGHYCHLRTRDTHGNWTSTIHLGPFWIDTTAPTVSGETCTALDNGYLKTSEVSSFDVLFSASDAGTGVAWGKSSVMVGIDCYDLNQAWVIPAEATHDFIFTMDASSAPDGPITIRIESEDVLTNHYGAATFTGIKDTVASTVPTGLVPDGSGTNDTTPALSWNTCTDANGIWMYGVNVRAVGDSWGSGVTTVNTSILNWSYPAPLTDGSYEWRVCSYDNAGNWSTHAYGTFDIDTIAPTVTINQAASQWDPTDASPILFTAVFSEAVTEFETGDVTLSGTAGATTAVVAEVAPNDGTTYEVAVSGMTGSGTVVASIPADVAKDRAWNLNEASTSTDNEVAFCEVITFADTGLEEAIRDAISKPTGDITTCDVSALTYLYARSRGITDLGGIEYCTALEHLDLAVNDLTSIDELSSLTELDWLHLASNDSLSDISPLAGLTKLEWLSINGDSVSDITALSGLTSLYKLDIAVNSIHDVSPLASLTNLEEIDMGFNGLVNISPVSGLTKLHKLRFRSNHVSDLSALLGLTLLEHLEARANDIVDVSALSGLTLLEYVYLASNDIEDLSPLVSNAGLGTGDLVDVSGNPLDGDACGIHIPTLRARGATVTETTCP